MTSETDISATRSFRHYSISTHVYLLHNLSSVEPLYKIGCSINPSRRRSDMANKFKAEVELVAAFEVGYRADWVEYLWHRCFYWQRVSGRGLGREWFYLGKRDVELFRIVTPQIARYLNSPEGEDWDWMQRALETEEKSGMRAIARRVQLIAPTV